MRTYNLAEKHMVIKLLYILAMGISCASLCVVCNSNSTFTPKQASIGFFISLFIGILIGCNQIRHGIIIEFSYKCIGYIFIALYLLRWLVTYTKKLTVQAICEKITCYVGLSLPCEKLLGLICVLAIPFTIWVVIKFTKFVYTAFIGFYGSLDKTEKRFFAVVTVVGIVLSALSYLLTTAFWLPISYDGNMVTLDVIYTTDTGSLVYGDVYAVIGHGANDIRQPLFGVFAMPFGLIAHFLSQFLPFMSEKMAYGFIMTLVQWFIVATMGVLILRMLGIDEKNKVYYLLVYSLCFPNVLFALMLEQYQISTFYVILCIYYWYTDEKEQYNPLCVPAAGTILTSGLLCIFSTRTRSISTWIKNFGKVVVFGFAVTTISGQLPILFNAINEVRVQINAFGGKSKSLFERLCQYSYFIKDIFVAPSGECVKNEVVSYWTPSYLTISIIGCVIFCIVIAGWILNLKKLFINISMLWVILSQIVLVVVGWGSFENGMVLYTFYFAWAYIILVFAFVERVIKHKKIVLSLSAIILLIWNVSELINIFVFAHTYYPA